MNTFNQIIVSAIAILACSCQELSLNHGLNDSSEQFAAVLEQLNAQTKTYLESDKTTVSWSKDDQIAVFLCDTKPEQYNIINNTAETEAGIFHLASSKGKATKATDDTELTIKTNVAFYPYSSSLQCAMMVGKKSKDTLYTVNNVVLPETQTFAAESFGNGAAAMTAISKSSEHHTLKFMHVLGAIRLSLRGTDVIKTITIQGNNEEKLSGNATVSIDPNTSMPTIVMGEDASTSVTLNCGDGIELKSNKATNFVIALPPVTLSKGYTVTITNGNDKTKSYKVSSKHVINRAAILATSYKKIESDPIGEEVNKNEEGKVEENTPEPDYEGMTRLTFTESDEIFANPERGFYKMYDFTSANASTLTKSTIEAQRVEHTTLFYTGYYLTDYIKSDIADKFLQMLQFLLLPQFLTTYSLELLMTV